MLWFLALVRKRPLLWPALALATVAFYSIPLFGPKATIHWDLAEVSYPAQKFLADSMRAGKLPHWTPFLNSGIPFLADPRTGAWYPLHWPFFLIGITPRAMVWELALHAFLALAGGYLLAQKLFGSRGPAVLGGVFYGFGGFFAAHSSMLGQFEAAAILPWLLWSAMTAMESGSTRWIAVTGVLGGLIVLSGDGPASLESLLTLFCVTAAFVATAETTDVKVSPWKRAAATVGLAAIVAGLLGAIVLLPAITLHSQSHPSPSGATFHFISMATVVAADYYGVISGVYSGPEDPRQYFLYGGLLLVPLALAGFARREKVPLLAAMLVPTIAFDLARRPPGDVWFPVALGLAMAAASGAVFVVQRTERQYIWIALLALTGVDLWFWNLDRNPLVFARAPFAEIYGEYKSDKPQVTEPKHPFARTWAPFVPVGLGPADGSLISRTEVTYGTGLAELDRYAAYLAMVENNAKLLNGLGVTDLILGKTRRLDNPGTLGRVSAPPHLEFVADRKAALEALATLDPAQTAVVEAAPRTLQPSVESLEITGYTGDSYHIRYTASSDSFVRIAVPYYPGWSAQIDGQEATLVPVDEALMGVFVPAGSHELMLQFQPQKFHTAVVLSGIGVIAVTVGLILP